MAGVAGGAIELATAYVQLVPSLRGAPEAVAQAFSGAPAQKAGQKVGDRIVDGIGAAIRRGGQIPAALSALASKSAAGFSAAAASARLVGQAFSASSRIAGDAAGFINTSWQGTFTRLAPGAAKALAAVQGHFQAASGRVGAVWQAAAANMARAFSAVGAPISAAWQRATAPIVSGFQSTVNAARGAASSIGNAFSGVASRVGSSFQRFTAPISSAFSYVGANLRATSGVIGNALSGIQATWSSAWAKMPAPVQALPGKIGSAFASVGGKIGSAISSGAAAAINAAASLSSAVGNALQGAISTGAKAAGVAVAGLASVIGANLGGAVQRADQLFTFPRVMANIGYSAEEADKQINRISDSLDGLPTATDEIVRMVQGIAPLTGDLTKATDISLAMNNALLAGGASTTLAANAMEQYRQQMAVGKVDMMAWRSMTNAMPGQMNQLAQSILGAESNSTLLYAAMKDGTVTFEDFNNALLKLNSEGMDGVASFDTQARTATLGIGTAFTNAGNRIRKAMAEIIKAIGVKEIADKINALTDGIVGFGKNVGDVITRIKGSGGFSQLGQTLGGLLPVIGGLAGALGPLLTQIPLIGGVFSGLTGPVGIVIGLFTSMMTHSQLLRDAIGNAFTTLGQAFQSPAISGALQALGSQLGTIAGILGDSLGSALNVVAPLLANMAQTIIPVLAQVVGQLVAAATPIVTSIFGALTRVMAALLPPLTQIAATVLPLLGQMFSMVAAAVAPVIDQIANILVQALNLLMPILMNLVNAVMPVIVQVIAAIMPPLQRVISAVMSVISAILPPLVSIIGTVISVITPIIAAVLPVLANLIGTVINWISSWISVMSSLLVPVINVVASVINVAVKAIGAIWMWLWNNVISPVINWITNKIQGWSDFLTNTVKPAITNIVNGIKDAFNGMKDGISTAFDKIKGAAAKPINFVINTVYTNGIKWLVDKVMEKLGLELRMPTISPIAGYATGGVLPGYTPGRDVYHFVSPDGGGSLALSGGEAIMRPEWTRAVGGPRMVAAMNWAARRGRPIPGGDAGINAFADGGIWGSLKSGAKSAWNWVSDKASKAADIIADPLGAVENLIRVPVNKLIDGGNFGGAFWEAGKAIPGKIVDGVADYLKDKTEHMVASDLVGQARLAIGTPYVWGGVDVPGGVDCSGLIVWALRALGHNVPRHTASTFQANSTPGNPNVPGTLLFWGGSVGGGGAHHVAVASGNGMMIEAPTFNVPVRELPIYGAPSAGIFKYDDGGWLQPGTQVITNQTRQPEAIFTGGQWSKIDQLLARENSAPDTLVIRDVDDRLIGRMKVEAERVAIDASRDD
nr:MAG TPA: Minor tail protein [Caudoviricetes sp.]